MPGWAGRVVVVGALVLPATMAFPSGQQRSAATKTLTVEQYLDYETVTDPQISRDGTQVVYTRRWVDKLQDKWSSALWIVGADGTRNRFLTEGSGAVWSPDGTRIAYVADGPPKGGQVWVRWMDGGAASQITRVERTPSSLRWSPDGKQIGFSMFVKKEATWDVGMPKPPEGAKWTRAPAVVDRLHYRQDRQGFTEPGTVHLFVVPADGGTERDVTPGDWYVGARFDGLTGDVGWDWSPDGRTIVVDGLDAPDADLRYRDSDVFAIDVASGARRKLTPDGSWSNPRIAPDGKLVAFVGSPKSKASYHADELYVVEMSGSGMRKISGNLDRDAGNLKWAGDGSGVYFTADDHGTSNVWFAPVNGAPRQITAGNHMLTLASLSRKGGAAVGVRTTPKEPPDVVRMSLAGTPDLQPLTRVNEDLLAGVTLGEVDHISYESTGGTKVDGWIVKPPAFDPSKRYPLVMEIHGGPHGMYNVGFNYMFQAFASLGYVVLYTNPRGSTGYGSAFGNAIERAYPSVDYDDLMAGVDATVARGYVDARSMFVGGCSGGGVLSSWVIGHTDRFAAAAVRCPVINWLSFVGHTDIPYFTLNFFEAPFWEKPEQWLKQSPLMYVGNVKTPTLLMTGVLDMRTPMPQSEEYFAALKIRGVESKLLRFEDEYHGTTSKPSNFMRTVLYMDSWYKQHRRDAPTTSAQQ